MSIFKKVVCLVIGHKLTMESKMVLAMLEPKMIEAYRYRCLRCGMDDGWIVTERL